ncbi:MAG: hypothetical protein EPO32_07975 [Anaerolineae bacterium]|nr:MAG: hypothetical protein EPO32_07975 [Anaerolineae bacterium]
MKRVTLLLIASFALAACTRRAPIPDPTELPIATPILAQPTALLASPTAAPTSAPGETPSPTPFIITPTSAFSATPEPTATPEPQVATESAASTATEQAAPTATRPPAATPFEPPFDPVLAFGSGPRFDLPSMGTQYWADSNGRLPNTDNIRIQSNDSGHWEVTGKNQLFDTWWFSNPYLGELYVEMEVRTGDVCSGRSTWGLILYGPEAGTSDTGAHGYIVGFTCEGTYLLRRLNSSDPYSADGLFTFEEDDLILAGPNQINKLGVLIRDGEIAIYANGYLIATAFDDTFTEGRFGLYVNAGDTDNFVYTITDFNLWDLRENR